MNNGLSEEKKDDKTANFFSSRVSHNQEELSSFMGETNGGMAVGNGLLGGLISKISAIKNSEKS